MTRLRTSVGLLAIVYVAAATAGFLAPYDPAEQNRRYPFAPPVKVHVLDAAGSIHRRPFVYELRPRPGTFDEYDEDRERPLEIRFFVRGTPYRLAGVVPSTLHLFGVEGSRRVFLMGTDEYGRDVLSRLLHGAGISLGAGLLAAAAAVSLGLVIGSIAGYYGGASDMLAMRAAELVMAVPSLYLLLALRAALPLHLAPADAFVLLVAVVGAVGWARPALLVRAVVSTVRTRDFVVAARSSGASDVHILARHVLPQAAGVALTQFALLVPQCVLAEVTLSFFGLGVSEPAPSWGTMLADLQRFHILAAAYWWLFLPAIAIVAVFLLYYSITDALHQRLMLRS
jgi:peptide/nickel transport system permease protein